MNVFAVNPKLLDDPSWFAITVFVIELNTRKLYVYGPLPPVTYDAMVMVWPLSYVVATLGDIVGVVSAELTVIVPDKIEFACASALSVTRTFAL